MAKYVYAVKVGFIPGVYDTWNEASKQVTGYPGSVFRKFPVVRSGEAYEFIGKAKPDQPEPEKKPNKKVLPFWSVNSDICLLGSQNQSSTSDKVKAKPKFKIKPVIKPKPPPFQLVPRELTCQEKLYFQHPDYNKDDPVLHVYTDGSAINNGSKNATGGYGVFFGRPNIPYISKRMTAVKITNNTAELTGIIEALKVISRLDDMDIVIHYDSDYASGVITGRKKAHENLDLVREGQDILRTVRIEQGKKVKFEHVYAHTGAKDIHSIGNQIVDDLAGDRPLKPSPSGRRRDHTVTPTIKIQVQDRTIIQITVTSPDVTVKLSSATEFKEAELSASACTAITKYAQDNGLSFGLDVN